MEKEISFCCCREELIKAVPTFLMYGFMLPEGLCYEIDSMIGTFWWGQNEDKSKIHWVNWDKLCKPKSMCGLVFRSLVAFNKAMMARILKANYFHSSSFMDARLGCNPCYTWRSIGSTRPVLLAGLWWCIGNGQNVQVWDRKWIPWLRSFKLFVPPRNLPLEAKVSCLIDFDRIC